MFLSNAKGCFSWPPAKRHTEVGALPGSEPQTETANGSQDAVATEPVPALQDHVHLVGLAHLAGPFQRAMFILVFLAQMGCTEKIMFSFCLPFFVEQPCKIGFPGYLLQC